MQLPLARNGVHSSSSTTSPTTTFFTSTSPSSSTRDEGGTRDTSTITSGHGDVSVSGGNGGGSASGDGSASVRSDGSAGVSGGVTISMGTPDLRPLSPNCLANNTMSLCRLQQGDLPTPSMSSSPSQPPNSHPTPHHPYHLLVCYPSSLLPSLTLHSTPTPHPPLYRPPSPTRLPIRIFL